MVSAGRLHPRRKAERPSIATPHLGIIGNWVILFRRGAKSHNDSGLEPRRCGRIALSGVPVIPAGHRTTSPQPVEFPHWRELCMIAR